MIFFSLIFIYSVEKTCSKIWAFERIIGFTLNEPADKEIKSIMLRTACQDLCLSERTFQCRSITYDYGRRLCRLFRETRRSKPNSFKLSSDHVDYFENKCANGNYFFVFYIFLVYIYRSKQSLFLYIYIQNFPHVNIETFVIVTLSMLTEFVLPHH